MADARAITAWRIVTPRWADSAFDGIGAKRYGGRWNTIGTPMVYTAGSLALAAMEMLVHLESEELLARYVAIPVSIPATVIKKTLPAGELPPDWRDEPIPFSTQAIGSAWAAAAESAVFAVPSTVIPLENNYLLNPMHPDFSTLQIGEAQPFGYDPRLLKPD